MSRHVIETLSWELAGSDRSLALAQQQRLSQFLRGQGGQALGALFDRLSPRDEVWRIDSLEVDLGHTPADVDDEALGRQLDAALDTALRRLRQEAAQSAGIERSVHSPRRAEENERDNFLFYLQYGRLHWSMPPLAPGGMADWLEQLARRDGVRLWESLQKLPHADRALERLAIITPCHGLQALLASRHEELARSLSALDGALLEPLRSQGRLSLYQISQVRQAWRVAGLHALWGQGGSTLGVSRLRLLMTTLADTLVTQLGGKPLDGVQVATGAAADASNLLRSLLSGIGQKLSGLPPGESASARQAADERARHDNEAAQDADRFMLDNGWHESLRQFALAHQHDDAVRAAGLGLSALQAYLLDHSLAYLGTVDRPPQDHVAWQRVWRQAVEALAHGNGEEGHMLSMDGRSSRTAEAPERPMIRNSRTNDGTVSPADDHPDNEAIYVANAGLVLLSTFTPRLFQALGLIEDNAFVDAAARHRAVHCLVYLSDGHVESEEHEWVLNKLLCGMAIDEPVLPAKSMDNVKPMLDSLLTAVVTHWKSLGQTTPAGLQQIFLRRIGRMVEHETLEGEHWRMKVQPGPFDVLLDRLPWGYGTIKLPWMKGAIHVDWR
ncbi:contractile injection system tape measure protein [Dyella sp.]|uniref:contractile injection system tape measure protein n=1 Tax=Dyella sp. TaxID=1869338 RepID=UPI002ED58C11